LIGSGERGAGPSAAPSGTAPCSPLRGNAERRVDRQHRRGKVDRRRSVPSLGRNDHRRGRPRPAEAQAPGGEVLAAIAGRFGADVLASDGTLDRAALRGKVMGDQAALDALNQIVHPAVRRRRDSCCARHRTAATCSSSTTSRCCSRRSTRPSSIPWSWWTRARRCGARGSAPCADSRTTRPTG